MHTPYRSGDGERPTAGTMSVEFESAQAPDHVWLAQGFARHVDRIVGPKPAWNMEQEKRIPVFHAERMCRLDGARAAWKCRDEEDRAHQFACFSAGPLDIAPPISHLK